MLVLPFAFLPLLMLGSAAWAGNGFSSKPLIDTNLTVESTRPKRQVLSKGQVKRAVVLTTNILSQLNSSKAAVIPPQSCPQLQSPESLWRSADFRKLGKGASKEVFEATFENNEDCVGYFLERGTALDAGQELKIYNLLKGVDGFVQTKGIQRVMYAQENAVGDIIQPAVPKVMHCIEYFNKGDLSSYLKKPKKKKIATPALKKQ